MSSWYVKTKITAAAAVICLALGIHLMGVAEEPAMAQPVVGDWLVQRLSAEPATLNPITATDVYEGAVNGYIYESLLERDNRTLNLVPNRSW